MNILMVNKYFFVSGGPERYMFSVLDLLASNGHNVIPLSLRLRRNLSTPHEADFLPAPFGEETSHFREDRSSIADRVRVTRRAIYYREARDRVAGLVRREGIDVVYLLNICNFISPSVIDGAKQAGAGVVMRLSDFNFICASYHFFRDGGVCMDCRRGMHHALIHRCMRGSLPQSLARVVAMKYHKMSGIYHKVDMFVAPSQMMADTLVEFGLPERRVAVVPSFVDLERYPPSYEPGRYVLFIGRLVREKGVDVLLRAWRELGRDAPPLRIVGHGEAEADLRARREALGLENVEFHGFLEQESIIEMTQGSAYVVIPSLWHDNSPMAAYEAMACGKAILASRLGGLVDQVEDGVSGSLLPPAEPHTWAQAVRDLWGDPDRMRRFGKAGRHRMETIFTPANHLKSLETIFGRCTS